MLGPKLSVAAAGIFGESRMPESAIMLGSSWSTGEPVLVKDEVAKLLGRHQRLVHSERKRVVSHVQRETRNWIVNTVMLEDCAVPFKFKRKKRYKNLKGQFVNLTYYPDTESVAGIEVEVMHVVRIRVS